MINVKTLLADDLQEIFSPNNLLRRFTCDGCGENVAEHSVTLPFGPNKGQVRNMITGCRCEDIELGRQAVRHEAEGKKRKTLHLFDQNSLINRDLRSCSFDSFEPVDASQNEIKQQSIQFAETFSLEAPGNLLYYGQPGVGKSHLATSTLKAIMEKGYTGLFISVPMLLTKLKSTFHKKSEHTEADILSMIERVDCLVLDDIGAEFGTDQRGSWAIQKIFEVVDSRLGKHTIFTTNLKGVTLKAKVGERSFSRIMYRTQTLSIRGGDYRARPIKTEKEMTL